MSINDFNFAPRRGWVCPLCGAAHNPIMMTCPCNGQKKPDPITVKNPPDRWETDTFEQGDAR